MSWTRPSGSESRDTRRRPRSHAPRGERNSATLPRRSQNLSPYTVIQPDILSATQSVAVVRSHAERGNEGWEKIAPTKHPPRCSIIVETMARNVAPVDEPVLILRAR